MQVKKSIIRVILIIFPIVSIAQSTYITQGDKAYDIIDRIEIKAKNNNILNFSSLKPYNRKYCIQEIEKLVKDSNNNKSENINLTFVDRYNLNSLLLNNSEWVTGPKTNFFSKKPVLKNFYTSKANLFEVNRKDLFLAVNPIISYQKSFGSQADKGAFLNTRGVTVRGLIANKIGFSTTLTDNQEQGPAYFNDRVNNYHQIPGAGFFKPFKTTGFDYFDARGYVSFQLAKLIDVQFGYDNNFIGNGYRSLLLSDYANSYLFLKLNVRKGKFEYQTLFTELMPFYYKTSDTLLDRKYGAFYHLSMNATKWLNIGIFEGVIFGTKNDFGLKNLNPLIFSRHIQGFDNSPDNAIAGIDIKANVAKRLQAYGQLLMDEFDFSQLSKSSGYWGNKTGYQAGLKYIDVFNVPNLDIQIETNKVRPFSYAYNNPIANYTHYNLPLAHPLGANIIEYLTMVKYQPFPKWRFDAAFVFYHQGLDSAGINFGSNPFENTQTRGKDFGNTITGGNKATCFNANFNISYELKENLFIEGGLLYRTYKTQVSNLNNSSKLVSIGLRWNIYKRRYNL